MSVTGFGKFPRRFLLFGSPASPSIPKFEHGEPLIGGGGCCEYSASRYPVDSGAYPLDTSYIGNGLACVEGNKVPLPFESLKF